LKPEEETKFSPVCSATGGFRYSTGANPLNWKGYSEARAAFSPQMPPELDYPFVFKELRLRAV
jgi:hypothetical protein